MKQHSNNFKIINIIVIIIAFISSFLFSVEQNKINYSFETEVNVIYKNASNDMTEEEKEEYYQDFWEKIFYEKNIKPSNKKFYRRFNRAYYWWRLRAGDSVDDLAVLEASKPHLLAALFLDYAPDNFNSDISEWAVNGDKDNIYINDEDFAYQVCDNYIDENGASDNDSNCSSGGLEDKEYAPKTILDVIARAISEAIAKAQEYLDDKDTIRALGRHLFVYQPVCYLTKELDDGTTQKIPYEYAKKYSFDEILDLISQIKSLKDIFSIFPEYTDCVGPDSKWLVKNGGDAIKTEFDLDDIVDLCYFYKHLVESDYFENHVHFKADFDNIKKYTKTDQEYLVESSKLKVGLARQIIDIVDLANDDDPVYDSSVSAASGASVSYSLSKDLYITLSNSRKDDNGNLIKNGSYPIDQYVEGVLDAEVLGVFYSSGESEATIYTALQANAIAIRTYALKVTNEGVKSISNSTDNQVFTDQYFKETGTKYMLARNAALSTTGQVLTENGQLIKSEYSSFSEWTNYYCENGLCYTSYQKIGSKNSGTFHTVIAKSKWGLSGGHNRGMSQWGSLYLASQGYTYTGILENFYAENVTLANYDYSYKSTDNVTLGEYGVKEAMLVCDLFTSSEYSDIRDLLGDNVTLKIPLRLTSTKYQSSSGYKASSGGTNGISYNRFNGVHGQVFQCEWNPEHTALLYACNGDKGYIINNQDYKRNQETNQYQTYKRNSDGTLAKDSEGNQLYVETDNASKRILLDVSEASRADVYLPSAIVWQYALNTSTIKIPTEGGWDDHGYIEAVTGFYPHYVSGTLPSTITYRPVINYDGTAKTETISTGLTCPSSDYELVAENCCLVTDKTQCEPAIEGTTERVVYETDNKKPSADELFASRYDTMLVAGEAVNLETEYNTILFTGVIDSAAVAITSSDPSRFWDTDHADTILYMYVPDYNDIDPELQPYFSNEVTNILQLTSASRSGNIRDGVDLVAAKGETPTAGFINVTEFLESLGFTNIGGMANGAWDDLEAHHWQLACDYSNSLTLAGMSLSDLERDYCCKGLFHENPSYDSYDAGTGRSYRETSSDLGGYFSDAWKIEFCNETIEGAKLVKAACKAAFAEQSACISQCYASLKEEDASALGYKWNSKGYWYNAKGPIFDSNKTAVGCTYNTGDFGATVSETRKIGPEGECPCSILGNSGGSSNA